MDQTADPASDFADRPWMDPETVPLEATETEGRESSVRCDPARGWRGGCHLAPLAAWLLPGSGVNLLLPILVWKLKAEKDGDAPLAGQAIESLNFQLNLCALTIALSLTIVGLALVPILWIAATVLMVIAAVKAYQGEPYRYPWIYRLF